MEKYLEYRNNAERAELINVQTEQGLRLVEDRITNGGNTLVFTDEPLPLPVIPVEDQIATLQQEIADLKSQLSTVKTDVATIKESAALTKS